MKYAVFKPSPPLKLFGSGVFAIACGYRRIQAEPLRIIGHNVVVSDARSGNDVPGRIDRGSCRAKRPVPASSHIPE